MNYYYEIKKELIDNEINKRIKDYSKNKYELQKYLNVGKLLLEAGKHYGEGIINEYSLKLTKDLGRGYSKRNLWLMIRFYELTKKMQTLSAQLSWSHYCELLSLKQEEISYYIDIVEQQNLSVRQLRDKIKNNDYNRLPKSTKKKLQNKEIIKVKDLIKNPIIIKNKHNYEIISEKILQKLILEDIENFMKELGNSFCFIGSEYKIKIGDKYNYIDLFLYNIKFRCYVVIEFKITELKKEHTGQIEIYMNYIDKNIKTIDEDKTIGIIIVKKNDKYIMEYCSDRRIIAKEYKII
ncbi:MAG: DUF1016 family protein [Bacilli bacterium]|nr:DUF1016 family protein [Bacilli bacterium]